MKKWIKSVVRTVDGVEVESAYIRSDKIDKLVEYRPPLPLCELFSG